MILSTDERASGRSIVGTGLHNIDPYNSTVEVGIMIDEKDCWGKDYGTDITALMLNFGFISLGLHNLMLRVYSFNDCSIRTYQCAGFRVIGRRLEPHRFGWRPYNEIYMDCVATKF